jgi:anti-sigma B factor antagonist
MIEISKNGDQFIIKPDMDVVASMASEFRSKLQELIQESPKILVIDLSGVEMVDSVGIGIIIATHNSLNKSGGKLRVTNVADDILTLFTTMRLNHHFTIEKRE